MSAASSSSSSTNGAVGPLASSSTSAVSLDAFRSRLCIGASDLMGERVSAICSAPGVAFLGTESGVIQCCALGANVQTPSRMVGKRKMGKKPIQQIEVIYMRDAAGAASPAAAASSPSRAVLIALTDSKLYLLDIHTLATVFEIAPKESFSSFCIDPLSFTVPGAQSSSSSLNSVAAPTSVFSSSRPPTAPRLCCAVKGKKKLYLYTIALTGTSGKFDFVKEFSLPDTILSMVCQGDLLAIGYKREYSLLNLATDAPTDVPVPVEGVPLLIRTAPNELLLSTNNSLGFFVSFVGEPLPKAPLVWSHTPLSFSACGGYVVAVMSEPGASAKDSLYVGVAVASLMDQKLVQHVRLPIRIPQNSKEPGATLLLASHPNAEHVLVSVSTSATSEVYIFTQTSIAEQIEQYLDAGLVYEASQLFNSNSPSKAAQDEFNMRAGWICLKELEFQYGFEEFLSKTYARLDPRELISLFPDLHIKALPFTLPAGSLAQGVGDMSLIVDTGRVRIAGRGELNVSQARKRKELLELSAMTLVRQARLSLGNYLWKWRQDRAVYLSKHPAGVDHELDVTVDTVLLYLYVEHETWKIEQSKPSKVLTPATSNANASSALIEESFNFTLTQLFLPQNQCLLPDSELYLSREKWYLSLAELFQSKGSLRKALEVWKALGEGKFKQREMIGASGFILEKKGKANSATSVSTQPGLTETVALLSTLNDQPLLWEFAEWVLIASPLDGLRIFLSTARLNNSNSLSTDSASLPPEKVLTFLKRIQTQTKVSAALDKHGGVDGEYAIVPGASSSSSSSSVDFVEAYLEYLVTHEKTTEVRYHTQLALCYLGKVLKLTLPRAAGASSSAAASSNGASTRFKPGHEPALRGPPRMKLIKFLQRSTEYDAAIVLQQLVELTAKTNIAASASLRNSTTTPLASPAATSSTSTQLSWTGSPTSIYPGAKPSYSGLDPASHESNLYEELLLLLSRLNKHVRVLQIYIYDLHDELGAANYAYYICRRDQIADDARRTQELRAAAEASLDVTGELATKRGVSTSSSNGSSQQNTPAETNGLMNVTAVASTKHSGEVFLNLLEIYFSDEYAKLWQEQHASDKKPVATKSKDGKIIPPPSPTDSALELLNEFYSYMDPVALVKLLPPTLPLASLSHLFSRLIPSTIHARRDGRLVSGLHKIVHLRTQQHCYALRSVSLSQDVGMKCSWCYKTMNEPVFVAHPLHAMRDPIANQFMIDFERGGNVSALTHDALSDELGWKLEMPKFVLVHYQCSAAFIANGGVNAFGGSSTGTNLAPSGSSDSLGRSFNNDSSFGSSNGRSSVQRR